MARSDMLYEAGGYVVASAVAFALDVALLALQVSVLGVPYLPAAALAFVAGTVFVYLACVRHIFEFRRLADARREFSLFIVIGIVGLALNLAVMFAVVSVLGLHYLLGKCLAACCTFGTNFGLRRWMLFTPWHGRAHEAGKMGTRQSP